MSSSQFSWSDSIKLYADKRLWAIFLLGCSSGFPWVLLGSALSGWLKDLDLPRATISFVGSVTVFYAVNFLWAPLVDKIRIPVLYAKFGQRRSWVFSTQLSIAIATVGLALTHPSASLTFTVLWACVIGASAATMDVAIDGYRIDVIGDDQPRLPAAAAMGVAGWWTGYSLPGFIAFFYADALGWSFIYLLLAMLMGLLALLTLALQEPLTQRDLLQQMANQRYVGQAGHPALLWLKMTIFEPFAEFVRRNGVQLSVILVLFILTFKLGESFLGRMSIQFYREIGYSNTQIAEYSKLIGWGATLVFTFLGSLLNVRFGVYKGLLIGGITMAASNLMFAWIASVGPDEHLLLWTIIVDNFTTAFSIVCFVAFLSSFTGVAFSASQYALLASIGNFGRTSMASFGGSIVNWLDGNWTLFFIFTSLMVIPALALLWWIKILLAKKAAGTGA